MKRTIRDIENWQGRRALVREDLNVPMDDNGNITDATRIQEAVPTLRYLVKQNARVIVMAHFGRPKGQKKSEFSLAPVAKRLQELMPDVTVKTTQDTFSPEVVMAMDGLKNGEILVLENTRFDPGEEANSPEFAKKLASLADVYVNDAFGAAHRAHASTEGVAHFVQEKVAGLLMEKEIEALSGLLKTPERPFAAIIGGSKVSTKFSVLESLLDKVDHLVIGGGMMFTFLKAQGFSVGKSLVEDDFLDQARALMEKAKQKGVNLVLPSDVVIADKFDADAQSLVVDIHAIPEGWMGLDIGPESMDAIQQVLGESRTVFWNGPLGVFEFPAFAKGTDYVARFLAMQTKENGCKTVLGGGDTVAALDVFHIPPEAYTHVSTGGGASMEFIEGKELPGIAVLEDATIKV